MAELQACTLPSDPVFLHMWVPGRTEAQSQLSQGCGQSQHPGSPSKQWMCFLPRRVGSPEII